MSRDFSECQTFTSDEEGMPEPETEDFLHEVVQNSLKTKRKGYGQKPVRKVGKDEQIL